MLKDTLKSYIENAEIKALSSALGFVWFKGFVNLGAINIIINYYTEDYGFLNLKSRPGRISKYDLEYFTGGFKNPWKTVECRDLDTLIRIYNRVEHDANEIWEYYYEG